LLVRLAVSRRPVRAAAKCGDRVSRTMDVGFTPVGQYLPLRRALTNNVRIRCTWRCQARLAMPGAPGDPQVHLASAYLKQGAPAIHRVPPR
jgi:hypothetical protein